MSILEFVTSLQAYRTYVTLQAFLFSVPYVCPLFMMGEGERGNWLSKWASLASI